MTYINPYDLLQINIDNLADIDSTIINKAKRKLLAEIELSDTNTIIYNGIELNKGDCLKAIDDLDNLDKKEFHFFIYEHKHLKRFLTKGKLSFFENYQTESIYKLPEFLDFISQFFAEQYDKTLLENYKRWNFEEVSKILSVKPITNETYFERCYKSTYAYVREIDNEINDITKSIADNNNPFIIKEFRGLDKALVEKLNVPLLNALPSYFQNLRNQVALSFRNLARDINNDPHNFYEPAFKIIDIANNILTDALTKQIIIKGFYTIKGNYENDLEKHKLQAATTNVSPRSNNTVVFPTLFVRKVEPDDTSTLSQSEMQPKDDFEQNSNPTNNYYKGFLFLSSALLVWSLFNNSLQKIVLSIATLAYLFSLINILKSNNHNVKRTNQNLIYFISLVICVGGFFYPFLSILVITYCLVIFGYSIYYSFFFKRITKQDQAFEYLLIAFVLAVLFWGYQNSQKPGISSQSEQNELSAQSNDNSGTNSNSSNYSSPTTDNSNSSSNNNIYTQPTQAPPPLSSPVYNFPYLSNGNITGCSNIHPRYNKKLSNKLIISCGSNADVAVKMIDYKTNKSIRYVYIHKNTTYTIWNIPEGEYFLKIAYGDDWGVRSNESNCEGRFTTNAFYKKGDEVLDYNLIYYKDGRYQVPSFSLKLNAIVTTNDNMDNFSTDKITENDFYNE